MGKVKKSIYASEGYPRRLDWFYDLILDLTGAREWVGERDEDEQQKWSVKHGFEI